MSTQIGVKIDFSARSLELSGPKDDVDAYLDRFADLIAEFRGLQTAPPSSTQNLPMIVRPANTLPAEFGEYFHEFANSITDVDRMLLAGHFVQRSSELNSFSTSEANSLLVNQGIKLANPSECVRRNAGTRRVFPVEKRRYRVSAQGLEYVELLRKNGR